MDGGRGGGVKEHPILFSGPMVRALLAGRKSVTRRMSRQWLKVKAGDRLWARETFYILDMRPETLDHPNPVAPTEPCPISVQYRADEDTGSLGYDLTIQPTDWRPWMDNDHLAYVPSIHMPRWASRIALVATEDARLERLQDITEEEARAEGVRAYIEDGCGVYEDYIGGTGTWQFAARGSFCTLWQSLHTKPGERWEDNPEVVRVGEFRRLP